MSDMHTTTGRAALLAAVLESPDDDAPRLVYADWLEEAGEADRAAFIRLFLHSETLRCRPSFAHNMRICPKCMAVEAAWALTVPGWFPPPFIGTGYHLHGGAEFVFDEGGRRMAVRGGFVEAITCAAADWIAHADAILAAHPIRDVWLTTWPSEASGFLIRDAGRSCRLRLNRRWPRVTFHLPGDPQDATGL